MTDRAEVTFRGADELHRTLGIAIDRVSNGGRREAALTSAVLVARKARSRTPVRTGSLLASIGYAKEGGDSAVVKATARHAPFVHWGTKYMRPRPFLLTAMEAESDTIRKIYEVMTEQALSVVRGV